MFKIGKALSFTASGVFFMEVTHAFNVTSLRGQIIVVELWKKHRLFFIPSFRVIFIQNVLKRTWKCYMLHS